MFYSFSFVLNNEMKKVSVDVLTILLYSPKISSVSEVFCVQLSSPGAEVLLYWA